MIIPGIFDELTERGYFEQASHPEELKECLDKERVTFYCGFDATADSLTLGHFVQFMVMKYSLGCCKQAQIWRCRLFGINLSPFRSFSPRRPCLRNTPQIGRAHV